MLRLRRELLAATFGHFRACGRGQRECIAYWLGPCAADGEVTEVAHPRHSATPSAYDVDGAWQNDLWLRLAHDALELRAQVHTHPAGAFHSARDDGMAAIQTPGFYSLVIPRFGLGPMSLDGAHLERRGNDGRWHETSTAEIMVM